MKFKKPPRQENRENIIPLINVVFLLLLFFMMTAKTRVQDPFVITPPRSNEAARQSDSSDQILYLSSSGELVYDGETTTEEKLISRLNPSHFDPPAKPLVIKADTTVTMPLLMEILDPLKQAGVNNVELLVVSD